MTVITHLLGVLESTASVLNHLEPVDPLVHALQCAGHALATGADDEMIVACAFHDVGLAPRVQARYGSLGHESAGYFFMLEHFSLRVAWLVGAHVDALRYLAARDPSYAIVLSAGSAKVLEHSGGPLVGARYQAFDAHMWRADALALRHWDEAAKDPMAATPLITEVAAAMGRVIRA